MTTFEDIQKAKQLIAAGKRVEARQLLSALVQADPSSAQAWFMLSFVVDSQQQAVYCLERAVKIDPLNNEMRDRLRKFKQQPAQPLRNPQNPPVAAMPVHAGQQTVQNNSQAYGVIVFLTIIILIWSAIAFIQISFAVMSETGIGSTPVTVCISGLWNIFVTLFNANILLEVTRKKKDMTRTLYLLSVIGTLFSLAQLFFDSTLILACIAPLYMGLGFFTYVEQSKLKV